MMSTKLKFKKSALNNKIKKILKDIKPYKPDKVILFGSQARGGFNNDSDIDLLIIKDKDKNIRIFERINKVLELLSIRRIDPIILTQKEIQNRLKRNDFFMQDVLKEGQIIYEK